MLYTLSGDCKLCASAIGKFEGTLKDQVKCVRSLSSQAVQEKADFIWQYDSNPLSQKGQRQVLILPPGYIFTRVSTHFLCITQNYGADNFDVVKVKESLQAVFAAWPQLKAGQYDAFWQMIEKQ